MDCQILADGIYRLWCYLARPVDSTRAESFKEFGSVNVATLSRITPSVEGCVANDKETRYGNREKKKYLFRIFGCYLLHLAASVVVESLTSDMVVK